DQGKYSDIEKGKFAKNMEFLRSKNFSTVEGGVEFPFVIKETSYNQILGNTTQFYRLKSVGKKRNSKEGNQPSRLINEEEHIATGTKAIYEPFELTGSKKQWKGAGVFGEIPKSSGLARARSISNF